MSGAHHRIPSQEGKMSFDTIFPLSTVSIELVLRNSLTWSGVGHTFEDCGLRFIASSRAA